MKATMFFATLAILLLLAGIFYGGYLLVQGPDSSVSPLLQPAPGERLLMSMEGFRFAQSENGRVAWRMLAGNADLYGNKEAKLKNIEIVFNSLNNKHAKLIGETGTMDTVSGNSSIHRVAREVKIMTNDGYLLTTNSLFWQAGERMVRTEDPFKLLGSQIYLEGVGLTADVNLHSVMVKNNVKAVLQK